MTEAWTVQRVLAWMTQDLQGLGIASPRLDSELLLSHALQCDRVRLYMDMQRPLDPTELAAVRALVVRRRRREPVAYILGRREFYMRPFTVDASVLVPRPETEVLVDRALDALPTDAARALDLCTGSGVIAVTLALERPSLQVDATDISEAALAVARGNAERLAAADRVHIFHGDLFAPLPTPQRYALIAANPPYVRDADWSTLAPDITAHEPRTALLAGAEGLDVVARICSESPAWLEPGGALLMEIGSGQAAAVIALLAGTGAFEPAVAHRDLAGIDRVIEARAKKS
jgi:release factor glutamine methyltransferase